MVLVAGGEHESDVLKSAELYDPSTVIYRPAGNMNDRRECYAACVLTYGMVLVADGELWSDGLNSAELYGP